MALSKSLSSYSDVKQVLDAALAKGEAQYRLGSDQEAKRWRMRAYQFRRLYVDNEKARIGLKGFNPSTPYDTMYLTLAGPCVVIAASRPLGELTDTKGDAIAVKPYVAADDPDAGLIEEMRNLVVGTGEVSAPFEEELEEKKS